jgi:hypothetical protein
MLRGQAAAVEHLPVPKTVEQLLVLRRGRQAMNSPAGWHPDPSGQEWKK